MRAALLAVLAVALAVTGCGASGHAVVRSTPVRSTPRRSTPRRSTSRRSAPGRRTRGVLRRVIIPGATSGFATRPAEVYLPPAAGTARNLPVLVLLHGVPGGPTDWVTRGHIQTAMDEFAARHGGVAPIVVMPDINGARRADTECVRDPGGADVERYLTADLPAWVLAHLPATPDRDRWAIAGISEGGTCATMLALRDFPGFRAFGDLSGLARPTVGSTDDPPATIRVLFGGSAQAYDEHDALWLLRHHTYPELAGWFACGARDRAVRADQDAVTAAARRARMRVYDEVVPGGHNWAVWRAELQKFVPWLWELVG